MSDYFKKELENYTPEELKEMFEIVRDELGLVSLHSVSQKTGIDYKKLRGSSEIIQVGDKKFVTSEKKMTEARIQQECYMWFHNSFPELRGLFFRIKNEDHNAISGARNKSTGVVSGVADTCLLIPKGDPIFIEFKTETGKQSDAQKNWESIVNFAGFRYEIIKSLAEFQELCKGLGL
jgi:hypothetical protein